MSAKDNFAQAMKELLNGEVEIDEKDEKKPSASSSFSSFRQPEGKRPADLVGGESLAEEAIDEPTGKETADVLHFSNVTAQAAPKFAPAPSPEQKSTHSVFAGPPPAGSAPVPEASFTKAAAPQPPRPPQPMVTLPADSVETTVIAAGTTLVGDMTISGALRVGGNIKGNLRVVSKMELNGKVIGDIEAAEAVIMGSIVRGNVTVENMLTMDADTTIIGNVSAKNVDIDGKIKGNLTVEERGHFQSNAVVVGNLMSGTVIIDEGAALKGDISITNAQSDNITVDEPDFDIQ